MRSTLRRIVGTGLGCVALTVATVAVGAPAGAADSGTTARHRPHLSAEARQCLADHGITRPIRPLTKEKVAALEDAAKACDIKVPVRRLLTPEQKQCLADHGITRPIRPLTKEKVAALKDAAKVCDITLPVRHHVKLTAEQRQCLQDQGISRPIRPLTKEKVQALRDAAKACGITRAGASA